jgi:hypothetical protein
MRLKGDYSNLIPNHGGSIMNNSTFQVKNSNRNIIVKNPLNNNQN